VLDTRAPPRRLATLRIAHEGKPLQAVMSLWRRRTALKPSSRAIESRYNDDRTVYQDCPERPEARNLNAALGRQERRANAMGPDVVREHLLAFQNGGPADHLDTAVDLAETLLAENQEEADPRRTLLLQTYASSALALRSRTSSAHPDDLERSVDLGRAAVRSWPPQSGVSATLRSNLAGSLSDLYDRDRLPEYLDEALNLYGSSIEAFRVLDAPLTTTLHGWGCAYHERAQRPGADKAEQEADLDRALAVFTEALEQPGLADEEHAEILNSLGLSLRARWVLSGNGVDLTAAEQALQQARALAEPGGETYVAAAANLASVLQDRADLENDPVALQEAVDVIQDVLRLDTLPDASPSGRRDLGERLRANLQTALVGLYWYTREPSVLEVAVNQLRSLSADLPPGPVRTRVEALLGVVLHETFERTGSLAALDQAVALQERVLDADGQTPGRMLNLGVSLLARFRRRHRPTDVQQALDLFRRAAESSDRPLERASAWNSAANALSAQQALTLEKDSLDEAVALRRRAVEAAPAGSLDRAIYQGNLGVDLLARYERRQDERDLAEALEWQRQAVQTAPGPTPPPTLLAGLADTEAQEAERSGDPTSVDRARAAFRTAFEASQVSQQGTALGSALSWGSWEARGENWTEALEAYERGLRVAAQLIGGQEGRADKESWLRDAQELSAAGAFAGVKARELRRAVVALERGRAVLLADALTGRAARTSAHGPQNPRRGPRPRAPFSGSALRRPAGRAPRRSGGANPLTSTPEALAVSDDSQCTHHPEAVSGTGVAKQEHLPEEPMGLDVQISRDEEALRTTKPGSRERAALLNSLAINRRARWEATGSATDLNQAVQVAREATTCDASEAEAAVHVNTLGNVLVDRFEHDGKPADLDDAIVAYRDAVAKAAETMRTAFEANLAGALSERYRRDGTPLDLDDALRLMDGVVAVGGMDDPAEVAGLAANRIDLLHQRYQARGSLADVDEAVRFGTLALGAAPRRTIARTTLLTNLGGALLSRYERLGNTQDLTSAIKHFSCALEEMSDGAPARSRVLNNLGVAFAARARTRRGRESALDLDRAVEAHRGAVQAAGDGTRAFFANGLAAALLDRYQDSSKKYDLTEAIRTLRLVVRATPRTAVGYPRRLGNLAGALALRPRSLRGWWTTTRTRSTYRRAVALALPVDSESALVMARNWGWWELGRGTTRQAGDAFDRASRALEQLFAAQLLRPHKEAWLSAAADVATSGAWAHVRSGELSAAVVSLEQGRAALLAEALGRNRAELRHLELQGREDLAERFRTAASRVTFLEGDWR
jgi:tetratricopeptide (TPR) repeat protein